MATTTTTRRSMSSPSIAQPLRSPIPPRPPARSDVFKPRLPLDPFSSIDHRRHNPILIPAEKLHSAAAAEPRRDVILVLGAPEVRDLEPLLQSGQFSSSLLILATHQPPTIQSLQQDVYPVIRILRLNSPLALENSGAVRFVHILESAERLARFWRRCGDGGIPIQELPESDGILEYPSALKLSGFTYRTNTTPSASNNSLSQPNLPSRVSSSLRLTSFDSSSGRNTTAPRARRESKLTPLQSQGPDPTQRPFDAIINFLPHDIPEKSILKHAILVTTISRPFLVAAVPSSSSGPTPSATTSGLPSPVPSVRSTAGNGSLEKRRSVLRRPPILSMYSMPPTPPMSSGDSLNSLQAAPGPRDVKAHLVHLLPSSKGKSKANGAPTANTTGSGAQRIAQSIESFLLSFSYPGATGGSGGSSGFAIGSGSGMGMGQGGMGAGSGGDGMEHAKAYLMETSAFREVIDSQMAGPSVGGPMQEARWTVANLVLSGCLDVDEEKAREQRKAVEGGSGSGTGGTSGFLAKQEVRMMSKQRAWVAGASEIIISAVPSNIVTATGLGIGVTPPSSSSIGSGSSFSSLSAAAASASLATTPSASAPASSPSLPLNKSKLLPPTPTTPTTPSQHRRHHSKSDPSYSPSSMETIRAPSSTLPSPVKEPLPPRRHSANAAAVAAATPPSPGQTSPTKVGFAGIGSGYGSSSSPYHTQPSRAVSVPVPAPAVRPSTHTRSHPRSASGSGSGSAVDPEVGQINSGVNSRGWPSSAPAHSSGMKHYMVAGHSGGSSGPSTVMPSVVPTPSTTTLVEVRSEAPVSSESSTDTGTGIGAKRSLRRVEGSRRIVAAPPTPPDSDESATVHVDRHLQEKEKASIRFEENVYRVPGAGSEEISSDGGKRRLLHKARVRGEGDVNEGVVGEKQVKRVSSGTSSRWKFWKSAAR